jgi:N-methylhydantoinase B
MTNTKNTPVEVIEAIYPIMCRKYSLRQDSGGSGKWNGGEGIIKHYRALEPCTFSIISDRREVAPKGIKGGGDGVVGRNVVKFKGVDRMVGGKETILLDTNDEIIIMTPGGGGYGKEDTQN